MGGSGDASDRKPAARTAAWTRVTRAVPSPETTPLARVLPGQGVEWLRAGYTRRRMAPEAKPAPKATSISKSPGGRGWSRVSQ